MKSFIRRLTRLQRIVNHYHDLSGLAIQLERLRAPAAAQLAHSYISREPGTLPPLPQLLAAMPGPVEAAVRKQLAVLCQLK